MHLFTCTILYIAIVTVTCSVWYVFSDSFITNGSCYQIPVQMYLLWMCFTENFVTWSQYYHLSTPLIPKLFFLEFYCPRAFYGHAMCFIIVAEWYINCIVIVALKNSGLYGKSAPGFSYKFIFSVICIIETFFPFIFYTRLGSTLFHSHILIQKALHSVFDLATWSAGENIARNIFINGVMFFCC